MNGKKECNHFDWFDEEMNLCAKEVILTLLNKINDEKKRVYEAFKREEGMKMKIKFVK